MYIYRAVGSRGKSLQEGAATSSYCLTNSHADCEHPTPGLVVLSNARGQRQQWTRLHLCIQLNSAFPGGKFSGSHTRSWPSKNLVVKVN